MKKYSCATLSRAVMTACGVLIVAGLQATRPTSSAAQSPASSADSVESEVVESEVVESEVPSAESPPGLNERFLATDLNIDEWVERFEIESREVYAARSHILAALQLRPGLTVADVGAGTGFFSLMFADAVGPSGWTFAVDISPRFIQHIGETSVARHVENLSPVLCDTKSVRLPPNSVDVVFVCDTYHHFEFPEETLKSIHTALRKSGGPGDCGL